jgi:thymidine phosphorylase
MEEDKDAESDLDDLNSKIQEQVNNLTTSEFTDFTKLLSNQQLNEYWSVQFKQEDPNPAQHVLSEETAIQRFKETIKKNKANKNKRVEYLDKIARLCKMMC